MTRAELMPLLTELRNQHARLKATANVVTCREMPAREVLILSGILQAHAWAIGEAISKLEDAVIAGGKQG